MHTFVRNSILYTFTIYTNNVDYKLHKILLILLLFNGNAK